MERIIGCIATKIINILDTQKQCSSLEQIQMYYGLQNLIYNVVMTGIILFLSCCMNIFWETFLLFLFFGTLRLLAGGYHFDSISKCILSTAIIILGGGKCVQTIQISLPFCILIGLILGILFFSYTPTGSQKNPYSFRYSCLQKKRLRITVCFFICLSLVTKSTLRTSIILSLSIAAALLIPVWNHRFQAPE